MPIASIKMYPRVLGVKLDGFVYKTILPCVYVRASPFTNHIIRRIEFVSLNLIFV